LDEKNPISVGQLNRAINCEDTLKPIRLPVIIRKALVCILSADENCALLGYYAACCDNYLPTFRDTVKKLTEWEPCSSRPAGRPRLRWLEQVEEDLKKMKLRN